MGMIINAGSENKGGTVEQARLNAQRWLNQIHDSGFPEVSILEDEIEDAGVLYKVLADLGGEKLVGKSPEMVEGTYWPRLLSGL